MEEVTRCQFPGPVLKSWQLLLPVSGNTCSWKIAATKKSAYLDPTKLEESRVTQEGTEGPHAM